MTAELRITWQEATVAWLARWAAPIIMGLAYGMLMITSDTDATGKAWMTIGFGFVLVVWFLIRLLTSRAALSRALAVGDTDRILEVADRELAKKTDGRTRAPLLLARAFAFEIRGEWPNVIIALDEVGGPVSEATRHEVAARRAGALAALGMIPKARAEIDTLPEPSKLAPTTMEQMVAQLTHTLARGRVLAAEGSADEARRVLGQVTKNIRATELQRATAHHYLATITSDETAALHRREVLRFAPNSWMAQKRPE